MLSSVAPSLVVERPYPGLRPFESHEAFLFHGRELHTQALLDRLASEHFLAVVGTSGSGKSSLVRAGLLPALYRGYLVGASTQWRIAVMRPGGAPLAELDRALAEPQALGAHARPEDGARTSLDITRAVRKANLPAGTNFLLVVDQFEELFRFETERRSADGGAEAALFVHNLLEAADSYDGRIYVVLTVRSDFLGRCAQFSGLPEALNRAQYLIPNLTREQRRQAIELPAQLAGVGVKPALVQQLLNDLGDDPAKLPVLQHALMRTFSQRKSGDPELTFKHYTDAGGIALALNEHAESLVKPLADGPRRQVERLFRCLTTVEGGRPVRRPARLDRIYAVLGVADHAEERREVDAIVRTFAAPENSLLVISTGSELTPKSVIDVSHESLIQNWTALAGWVQAEIRTVDWYRSLAGDYVRFYDHDAGPWRDPELKRAVALRERDRWNEAWAEQYLPKEPLHPHLSKELPHPRFAEVMRFLGLSLVQQREEEQRQEAARKKELEDAVALTAAVGRSKKLYRLLTYALAVVLVLGGLAVYLSWAGRRAERLQAQRELELRQQVTSFANAQDQQQTKLRQTEEALMLAAKDSALAKDLLVEKARLQQALSNLSAAQEDLRQRLKNPAQSPKSSYSESLIAIADLQAELKEVREERDQLKDTLDTYNSTRIRDAGYWKSRADTAEAEVKRLNAALAAAKSASGGASSTPAGASKPAGTARDAFARGVEALDAKRWDEAEHALRDAIALQAASYEVAGPVLVGGTSIPWSPRTYLVVFLADFNRCAEAMGLFGAANLENKTVQIAQRLLAAGRKCATAK